MKRYSLHYTDGKIRRETKLQNEKKAGLTNEHTFRPNISHEIPDYELLVSDL